MDWQAPGGPTTGGTPTSDPFTEVEAALRAAVSSPWWASAVPQQRAGVVTSRMLAGAGEWWVLGLWGRWYRCGLDGNWYPCPPPADHGTRQGITAAPPGAGRPPVPLGLLPTGPDLASGPLASTGLFGKAPPPAVLARLQQTLAAATAVDPGQFPLRDQSFAPGTPSTVAAVWWVILWSSGAPVTAPDNPVFTLVAEHLNVRTDGPGWFLTPPVAQLAGLYCERLRAGDPRGAAHLLRAMWSTAETLRGDARFRPRADAIAGITAVTMRMVNYDHGAVGYGDAAITREWFRRCPPEVAVALLQETAPGDHFRLARYDLAAAVGRLPGAAPDPTEAGHAAVALLAADLGRMPGLIPGLLPWLDPDGGQTLQAVAGRPDHPLRELWPVGGSAPPALQSNDPEQVRTVLAACYALDLAWCRLLGVTPLSPGLSVPAALMNTLADIPEPGPESNLSPWEIIEAARAHLAGQREAESAAEVPAPSTVAEPVHDAEPSGGSVASSPEPAPPAPDEDSAVAASPMEPARPTPPPPPTSVADPPAPPAATTVAPEPLQPPAQAHGLGTPPPWPPRTGLQANPSPVPPPTRVGSPGEVPAPASPPPTSVVPEHVSPFVEEYGITLLPGPDDVGGLLTELRRRGKWARSLRGQEVSSASAPAVLLVGDTSCGQRRLSRMIARALADAGISSGEVHMLHADELVGTDAKGLRAQLAEHGGHTLLLEGLDTLLLDGSYGEAYASALYRARVEGVSDTNLIGTCAPERSRELTRAHPDLLTDFRTVRLVDLTTARTRVELAELLATERNLTLSTETWETVRTDLARLRGRGRLVNARLVETYLDRACTRGLSRAGETRAIFTDGETGGGLVLSSADFRGVADELEA